MHRTQRAQSWQNCDQDIKDFVTELVGKIKDQLGDNLTGVYLHGSLAMGCYYRPKSDIDIICVVAGKLSPSERELLSRVVAQHADYRPTIGNVELSVIQAEIAKYMPVPTPYEVHYSSEWHDKILANSVDYAADKTDIDLQVHPAYVKQRGLVLAGAPIDSVFGDVNWRAFTEGALDDLNWILKDEHILETPFYSVLNICRVLRLLSEDKHWVYSKDEGGEWALVHLPEKYQDLIRKALHAYHSDKPVEESQRRTNGEQWNRQELLEFRDYAAAKISNN